MENRGLLSDKIVFFDGYCNLCSRSVQFILKNDRRGVFSFASLQSPFARKYFAESTAGKHLDSVVLVSEGRIYRQSEAALRISAALRWPWKLLSVFLLFPSFLRDPLYRLVARNRYRWFGRREMCFVPKDEWKNRFIV